jgi:hypothetical protein
MIAKPASRWTLGSSAPRFWHWSCGLFACWSATAGAKPSEAELLETAHAIHRKALNWMRTRTS